MIQYVIEENRKKTIEREKRFNRI